MTTLKRPRDTNQLAKAIINLATDDEQAEAKTTVRARKAGEAGGPARARVLTPDVALHMMYYNFVRIHQKLRVTPAMAVGVSDKLWEIKDITALVEAADAPAKKRGPYKKQDHKDGRTDSDF